MVALLLGNTFVPNNRSITPMGTLTKNIQRQEKLSMIKPPIFGHRMPPIAKMLPKRPIAGALRSPKASLTMPVAEGRKAPPPIP